MLREGGTYRYFPERYALDLLARVVGEGVSVRWLRRTRWARLLERRSVRRALARAGNGVLTAGVLQAARPAESVEYELGGTVWNACDDWDPECDQTSRPGANVVLQLNLVPAEGRWHRRAGGAMYGHRFEDWAHPVRTRGTITLAWVRLDIDEAAGEVLIEEIQSDFIRGCMRWLAGVERSAGEVRGSDPHRYWLLTHAAASCLHRHGKLWSEAALWAAVRLCHAQLGIHRFFLHTPESNRLFKQFDDDWCPPRSLYTTLPRSFAFQRTEERPEFLHTDRRGKVRWRARRPGAPFWLLRL